MKDQNVISRKAKKTETHIEISRKGGQAKSPAKTAACRKNASRPRKKKMNDAEIATQALDIMWAMTDGQREIMKNLDPIKFKLIADRVMAMHLSRR